MSAPGVRSVPSMSSTASIPSPTTGAAAALATRSTIWSLTVNEHKKSEPEKQKGKDHPHYGPQSCPICGGPIPCLRH